jgi:23S rRNA (adenine2503-C2)-methyltransferase
MGPEGRAGLSREAGEQRIDLLDLSPQGLEEFAASLGEPPYRGRQLLANLHSRRLRTFQEMTDLPQAFRARLEERARIWRPAILEVLRSADGSRKFLFGLEDGLRIESVLMPMERGYLTLCLSSQAGCAMGCRFCLTGARGLARNLSASEIVGQVAAVQDYLQAAPRSDPALEGLRLANLVFMGMGEPLANFEALERALALLCSPQAYNFSRRRITVSTCGHLPGLARLAELFARSEPVNLAVSLNSADEATRSYLMPVNRRWPLARLMAALRALPLPPRRRITFEYILIAGVNDSEADARKLAKLLRGLKAKINLIPFNEHPGSSFRQPGEERILAFQKILVEAHYTALIRRSRGADILAACGQLSGGELPRAGDELPQAGGEPPRARPTLPS